MEERRESIETTGGNAVPPNFSEMLDKVLANPEIISTVAAALSKGGEEPTAEKVENAEKSETLEKVEVSENEPSSHDVAAMMQKLPDVMKLVGPMMSKGGGKVSSRGAVDKRACLLNAIKPYLNPHRCEAIDYIIRFSELSELIKNIH
ncbi:MAG: hypothetical protein IKB02_00415 [Clostridia bacterium]|nr:hypothetical protein [Clostridia bacterium]